MHGTHSAFQGHFGRARRILLAAIALALAAGTAATGRAQDAPTGNPTDSSAASANSGQLETVVVTSRYTAENVQSTPIALTALTTQDLTDRNLTNVTDLEAAVPNLFTHPGDAAEGTTPTITMRGVTAGDYNFTFEPAVGIYIDDVYHNTLFGSAIDLMDLDRVEVLRGPQGTLFGNSSIGGAIRLFSKTPKGDDSGYLEAGYGSYNAVDLKGAYDVAIVPQKLFLRISGLSSRQDGYVNQLDFACEMKAQGTPALAGSFPTFDNSAYQRGCVIGSFGGTDLNAIRAILRYLATDKLEFNFQAAYTREVDEAAPEVLVNASPSTTDNFVSAYNQNVFNKYGIYYGNEFLPPAGDPYSSYASFDSPLRALNYNNQQGQNSTDLSGKMDYDITNDVHLKTILAYSNYGGTELQNPDLSPLAVAYAYATFDVNQGTAEVNLTGNLFDKKLEWVVGGFWLRAGEFLGGAQNYVVLSWAVQDYVTVNNKSGFAHVIYHVTPQLSIFGGARYSADEKTYSFDHPGLLVIPTPFPAKQNLVDWTAGANYQITDDVMSYVTVATGSRPPGIFARPVTVYQLTPIPSEKLISYETGLKSDFFDHRLRVNLAAYYTDYSNYLAYLSDWQCLGQSGTPTPVVLPSLCPPGGSVTWGLYTTIHAQDEGGEAEITAEPLPGLTFNLNGGFNDFQSGVTQPGQPGYIAPGNLIQPKWNIAAGVQYAHASKIGVFTPRLDWVYQSEMTFNPSAQTSSPIPLYTVPGRSVFNARLTYEPNDSKWAFVFAATNLTNKYYYWDLFTGSGFDTTGNLAPPREFKFSAQRSFF